MIVVGDLTPDCALLYDDDVETVASGGTSTSKDVTGEALQITDAIDPHQLKYQMTHNVTTDSPLVSQLADAASAVNQSSVDGNSEKAGGVDHSYSSAVLAFIVVNVTHHVETAY